MIQSLGMLWICDGEHFNINCISVSFTNKLHYNQDALFFLSKKFVRFETSQKPFYNMMLTRAALNSEEPKRLRNVPYKGPRTLLPQPKPLESDKPELLERNDQSPS